LKSKSDRVEPFSAYLSLLDERKRKVKVETMLSSPAEITKSPPQVQWLQQLRAERLNDAEKAEDDAEASKSKLRQRGHVRKLRQMQSQNLLQRSFSSLCEIVSLGDAA
jgi:hypothetical protein